MAAPRSHTPKAYPRRASRGAAAMRYATICSGIEAVSVALIGMDAEPVFFADIEPFPKALLAHHYPDVPDLGDMTQWREWPDELLVQVDLIVAGTPCQAFSVAGARRSLDDDRGNLTLQFVRICNAIDHLRRDSGRPPVIIVWENVPGVLSVADNAFGCFLAAVAGSDAPIPPPDERSWTDAGVVFGPKRAVAWRCLDAQYFGVAQRRKRVFAVASAGNGPHPAQILFESDGVRRDSAPSRETGQRTADSLTVGANQYSGFNGEPVEDITVMSSGQANAEICEGYSPALNCNRDGAPIAFAHIDNENNAYDMSRPAGPLTADSISGGGRPLPAIAFNWQNGGDCRINPNTEGTDALQRSQTPAVAFKASHYTRDKDGAPNAITPPLSADADTADQDTLVFEPRYARNGRGAPDVVCPPLKAQSGQTGKGDAAPCVFSAMPMNSSAVSVAQNQRGELRTSEIAPQLTCGGGKPGEGYSAAFDVHQMAVRRLTPVECERLQGFPDNYTRIPYRNKPASQCPDGPRYRALGNSMAVPVMRWILQRVMA